jgi:hypothetical protein
MMRLWLLFLYCRSLTLCSKCSGERPVCDTCNRRGYQTSCHYIRPPMHMPTSSTSNDILEKLRRLEELMEHQVYLLESRQDLSPAPRSSKNEFAPIKHSSPSESPPRTEADASRSGTAPANATQSGSIVFSQGGYEKFVPGLEPSGANAVRELIQDTSAPAVPFMFPISDHDLDPRHKLLEILPPADERKLLKDLFFHVFSPVSSIRNLVTRIAFCLSTRLPFPRNKILPRHPERKRRMGLSHSQSNSRLALVSR